MTRRVRPSRFAPLAALAALAAHPAAADDLLSSLESIIQNSLCVGHGCLTDETFGDTTLRIKGQNTRLDFTDTTTNSSFPTRDWAIAANDTGSGGLGRLRFEDTDAGTVPVSIVAGAPENALFISATGKIGLGTSLPATSFHLVRNDTPTLKLDQQSAEFGNYSWSIPANETGFAIANDIATEQAGTLVQPFLILPGAPHKVIVMTGGRIEINQNQLNYDFTVFSDSGRPMLYSDAGTDRVGIGTDTPQAMLHVSNGVGTTQLMVEETSTTTSPRTLLNLQNNGRPEIVMANTDTGGEWSFGAGTNFILKQGAVGSASNAKTKLFEIDPAGNATLTGSLVTGGTTCGTGCDAVFAPDYPLPSIADHAAQMQALGYLPNVGPTLENTPINVTDKLGRMLNELEHAHLYIAQLERENGAQTDLIASLKAEQATQRAAQHRAIAEIAVIAARLAALEARN